MLVILDKAVEIGIDRERVEEIYDMLRREGDIFEPRPGMVSLP